MSKLKNLQVHWVSLVQRPATGKTLTLKSAGGAQPHLFEVAKMDGDMMRAYGVVYAPDEVDSQGDFADADTIRKAANGFMRSGRTRNVDEEHGFDEAVAFVAESWLVRSGDPMFPDEPEGAWVVGIQVGDKDLWDKLKAGELTGLSLAGVAQSEDDPAPTSKADQAKTFALFTQWWRDLTKQTEEDEMTKEEIEALVKSSVGAAVTEAVSGAVGPAVEAAITKAMKSDGGGDDSGGGGDDAGEGLVKSADLDAMEARITKANAAAIADALAKGSGESAGGGNSSSDASFL